MDGYKPGLAVLAAACTFIALTTVSVQAQGAGAIAMALSSSESVSAASPLHRVTVHRKRVSSFYCYPRKYWWFYRPYTTDPQNHARCMPYFHYLGPGYGRGAKGGGYPK
jgi:hypothetical protein